MKEEQGKSKNLERRVDKRVDESGESTSLQTPPRPNNNEGNTSTTIQPTTAAATQAPMPPLPPLPGAVRVGSDSEEEMDSVMSRGESTTVGTCTQEPPISELPVAAELSADTSEELRALKQQLKQYQETTVEAVAVGVSDKEDSKRAGATFDMSLFSTRRPDNAVAGVSSGTKSLCKGVLAGAVSIVTEPVVGAQEDGVKGMVKGVFVGAGKCVGLPLAGFGVGCYQVGRGTVNSVASVVGKGKSNSGGEEEECVNEIHGIPVVVGNERDVVVVGSGKNEEGAARVEDDDIELEA